MSARHPSSRRLVLQDLQAARAHWLVTISHGGRDWRFSAEQLDVVSGSALGPGVFHFDGGLDDVDVQLTLSVLSKSPEQRSVSLDFVWPEDLAELIERGLDFAKATGEVALWLEGTSYEQRVVHVAGKAWAEYGADGEPVSLTISEETGEDQAQWPPRRWRVTRKTWPDAASDSIGAWYPTVFGAPGVYIDPNGDEQHVGGSPAVCVDYDDLTDRANVLLIAGHRVSAEEIRIVYSTSDSQWAVSANLPITYMDDGLGHECAVVDVSGESVSLRESGQWFACWSEGGGMLSPFRPGAVLDQAGELLRWWANKSTLQIDFGALATAAARLRWPVAGFVNEPVVPWDWVGDNLLPILPVSLSSSVDGIAIVPWRYDAVRADAVDHLEMGPGVSRIGRPTYERQNADLRRHFRIDYAKDAAGGAFQAQTTLAGDADLDHDDTMRTGDVTETSSAIVRASSAEDDQVEDLSSDVICSSSTAMRVLAWVAFAYGLAHRAVVYECDQERVGWWSLGDVVTLTDADEHWSERVALVQGLRPSDTGRWVVALQVLADVVTRAVTTGPGASQEAPT